MGKSNSKLLQEIDDDIHRHDPSNNVVEEISNMFDRFDTNHSGVIDGIEVSNLLETVSQYIFHKYQKQITKNNLNISQIRLTVNKVIDTNHDAKITKEEFINGLKVLL